jgi:molybdate transport system substrate-binding protein
MIYNAFKLFIWTSILSLNCTLSSAHEIPLYAAAGVKAPAEELMQTLQTQIGHKLVRVYDTAGAAEQRFVEGGVTQAVGDTLAGIAISRSYAPSGQPRPAIDTPEALKQALLSARRIAFSDPARGATVGVHFMRVIDDLGIRDAVLAKAITSRDGIETMKQVIAGEADLGITQVSEIMQADASTLLGPFPAQLELATRYSFWYADNADANTKTLADTFTAAPGRAALARHGLRVP